MNYHRYHKKIVYILSLILIFSPFFYAFGNDEITSKIEEKNKKIKELEEEILKVQTEVQTISKEKQTLEKTVKEIDLNRTKITKDISLTENKIESNSLHIEQLAEDIDKKEESIKKQEASLSDVLRTLQVSSNESLLESFLKYKKISDLWTKIDTLTQFQTKIRNNIEELESTKISLSVNISETEARKNALIDLQKQLEDKKEVLEYNKQEKATILQQTKNKEQNYKTILDQKIREKETFEKDLLELESAIKLTVNPNSIPQTKSGILNWPVTAPKITQYFGNTTFSTKNPQIYGGKGHNGVDLGMPVGTPILAASEGVIEGTGNTDEARGCYSYGKWILVRHTNGISTLYAHLSVISAPIGKQVKTGEVIGYSGNTGYSTGPHLHFTVYASDGVEIQRFASSRSCQNVSIPIADLKAYLNPLSYLPAL